jgi:hypothetical protein
LNVQADQVVVLWQAAQLEPKALLLCDAGLAWQAAHVLGVPVNRPPGWQLAQDTLVCDPVSVNDAVLWSNDAGAQALDVWQVAQSLLMALLPCDAGLAWQATHVVGVPTYLPLAWQLAQAVPLCAPARANAVFEWSKVTSFQPVTAWQAAQSPENCPRCGSAAAWQALQVTASPVHLWSTWQASHDTVVCFPARGYWVWSWLMVAAVQFVAVWHCPHEVPRSPLWTSLLAWHATHSVAVAFRAAGVVAPLWQAAQAAVACVPTRAKEAWLYAFP